MRHMLKELDALAVPEEDGIEHEDEDDDQEEEENESGPVNPFAFLLESEGEDGVEEEQVSTSGSVDGSESPLPEVRVAATSQKPKNKNNKKSKKKGKERKKAQMLSKQSSSSSEDIDQVLKELNMHENGGPVLASDTERDLESERRIREMAVFRIDPRLLQGSSELKRIFGSDVTRGLSSENDEHDHGSNFAGASRRIRRLAARGLIKHNAPLKKGILITPRSTWPPYAKGDLVLTHVGTSHTGKALYSYVPSRSYESIQSQYRSVQASYNPRNLMGLLQLHPYHIDSLLSIGDVYRSTGDGQYADEMLEMCIYALEQGWPSSLMNLINSPQGIEIPYQGYNVSLFVALMRHVQTLGKRGLHRTALEVCKLVLSLNSDDPCGALFTIDYFALRCSMYSFLNEVAEFYDQGGAATMPNIVYSLALAKYYQEHSSDTEASGSSLSAEDLMAKALMLHPPVLVLLQRKLSNELNLNLSDDWIRVLHSAPFSLYEDGYTNNPSLQKLVDIFVERNHLLWKTHPIQQFLLHAAERVAGLANASTDMQREGLPLGLTISDWSNMREQAFPENNDAQYSHLRVDDFSDSVAQLPPEEMQGALAQEHDLDEEEIGQLIQQFERGEISDLEDAGAVMTFLRSLLPWVNAGQQPSYDDEDDGDAA